MECDPFQQGKAAYLAGLKLNQCPYPTGRNWAREWRRGWHHQERLSKVKP